jgi:hypothetical protein
MNKKKEKLPTSQEIDAAIDDAFPVFRLNARLPSASPRGSKVSDEFTQSEICAHFSVTDQTIRNWMERGLPWGKGPRGKPRYPRLLAMQWGLQWMCLERQKKAPKWLSPAEALFSSLADQHRHYVSDSGEWYDRQGPLFMIVPLDWGHPLRELTLRIATRGAMPPLDLPTTAGEYWHEGEMPDEGMNDVIANLDKPLERSTAKGK